MTNLVHSTLRIAALSTLLATLGLPALAQSPAPAPAAPPQATLNFGPRVGGPANGMMPPKVVASFGDWNVTCEDVPLPAAAAAAAKTDPAKADPAKADPAKTDAGKADPAATQTKKSCGVIQTSKSEKNPNIAVSLIMVKAKTPDGKDGYMMRVMAPIGVFLPLGVALEIDGAAVGRVPFTRCVPQICMAFAEASPPTLEKLKKGKAAQFIIYEAPGAGLPMKFTLKGLGEALAALEKTGTGSAE